MRQCDKHSPGLRRSSCFYAWCGDISWFTERNYKEGAEFGVPETDWAMGFQYVTKYWVAPGWHQPGPISGVMVKNKPGILYLIRRNSFFKEASMAL